MTRVVLRCGRMDCDRNNDPRHNHSDEAWQPGDVVVVEPKRPTCPGYAYGTPAGVVQPADGRSPGGTVPVLLDGAYGFVHVPADLLTRYHAWRKRKPPTPKTPTMPRLGRLHLLDPAHGVVEPPLFGATEC